MNHCEQKNLMEQSSISDKSADFLHTIPIYRARTRVFKHTLNAASIVLFSIFLCGCSSSLSAIFERSVSSENISYDKILTMTGERRIALVVPYVDRTLSKEEQKEFYTLIGHHRKVICAESLPDAARAVDAKSDITANLTAPATAQILLPTGQQKLDDSFKTSITQTFIRTETADVIRQLGWQICQSYANGAIQEAEYRDLLKSVISGSFDALIRVKDAQAGAAAQNSNTSSKPKK